VPASALALLPALRGLNVGERARVAVFVGESQSLEQAELRALAYERSPLFEGAALRVATTLLGLETETWYDAEARPLLETALHGAMISALEAPSRAQAYLVEASLNKDEALLDFSLLRSAPVHEPRRVAALTLVLEGVPAALEAPSASGQRCARAGERLECRVDRRAPAPAGDARQAAPYLLPSLAAPSNERRFLELAQSIAGDAGGAQARIERLLAWIDANIAKAAVDAFSAADVLRERRAECQGHAYLFAALARALGLPTRVVNGLVYSAEHGGFLYHSWNEVWLEGAGWDCSGVPNAPCEKDGQPLVLTISANTGNTRREAAQQIFKEAAKPAGFELDIENYGSGVYFGRVCPRGLVHVCDYASAGTPAGTILFAFGCDYLPTEENEYAGGNWNHYCNPENDALMKELDAEVDTAKRIELATQVQEILREDAVSLPMYLLPSVMIWRADTVGGPLDLYATHVYSPYFNMYDWYAVEA